MEELFLLGIICAAIASLQVALNYQPKEILLSSLEPNLEDFIKQCQHILKCILDQE